METVRQYALEKLGESGEADAVRARHRDHYTAMAAVLDAPAGRDYEHCLEQANIEIDNLRAAFAWSRENSDIEPALALASSLQPLWQARGRIREGRAWFDATLADLDAHHAGVTAAVRARALADKAVLDTYLGAANNMDQAEQAVAIARDVDDPALLARALTAYGFTAGLGYNAEVARECLAEAIGLARAVDDQWRLSQILAEQARGADLAGDPLGIRAAGEEGRDLAEAIGDGSTRVCVAFTSGGAAVQRGFGRSRRTVRRGGRRGRGGPRRDLEGDHLAGRSFALAPRVRRPRPWRRPKRPLKSGRGLAEGGRVRARGVGIRGLGRWGFRGGARGARGGPPVPDCREWWLGGIAAHLECRGCASRPRSRPARRWADEAVST